MAKNNTTEKTVVPPKAPVVPSGEYYKNVKVRFLGLICGEYGTFNAGDVGEIPLSDAKILERIAKCEIIEE